ncbi:thiol peroxidase [Bombilactobacillus folatiphilus]|uniref:Thiol peroxidase n=1 Tax=Bombilactobacillus folatiphilus TaxID=2923362 RepID=A0ABY4P888_9LACO|nr:thiol peroxidase [Bombilactobacillus folatiphilus]UQS81863.1 thiol peroxidase [Bombilactobacillus folatiphilus]
MKITRNGDEFCTITNFPEVGQKMPNFTVRNSQNKAVQLTELLNQPLLISVVPDINTSVCSLQTKQFNQKMDAYQGINFVTISTNTVEDQAQWCAAEGVKHMQLLSDAQQDFGQKTNLLMADSKLLARSVWVIDPDRTVIYHEIVPEMTHEPNYDQALDQLNQN